MPLGYRDSTSIIVSAVVALSILATRCTETLAEVQADLEPEVARSISRMQSDISHVRFYSGKFVLSFGYGDPTEVEKSTSIIKFSVGQSDDRAAIIYESILRPQRPVPGMVALPIDGRQTRYYDQIGAVIVRDRNRPPERLTADYRFAEWASKEQFLCSPQLIAEVLGSLWPQPDRARSVPSLGLANWNTDAAPDDRYMYCPSWNGKNPENLPAHAFYAAFARHIRFAAKYDYRPDLILIENSKSGIVWESFRLTWAEVDVGSKRIWFPKMVRKEWYHPAERQSREFKPTPMWKNEVEFDRSTLSELVPFSLVGPNLPPGVPRRVVTSGVRELSKDQMDRLHSRYGRPPAVEAAVGSSQSVAASDSSTAVLSARMRVVVVSVSFIIGVVCLRFLLAKLRRSPT